MDKNSRAKFFEGIARQIAAALFCVNRRAFVPMALTMFLVEIGIVHQIIGRVPYTEIDWSTYMQQVKAYNAGQRNYSQITGDTGPIVYPAAHLHFYRLFHALTDGGKCIRCAQHIFAAVYLLNLLLVFRLFYKSGRIPPFVLPLICLTSYRLHSIFLLRLFNDPIAMFLFFVATNLFVSHQWTVGCIFYSLAIGAKMNILLFAPALFFILLLSNGWVETIKLLAMMAMIQVTIALEFLLVDPFAYIGRAFELSRVFLFEWTVNWRFLPEALFLDRRFHCLLLCAQFCVLAIFAAKFWFRSTASDGLPDLLKRLWYGGVHVRFDAHDILFALFTSNLVGMALARSLHYQFYCWYYHSLPYLLFSSLYSAQNRNNSYIPSLCSILIRVAIVLGIEWCWNVFPSTSDSSLFLNFLHLCIFILLYSGEKAAPAKTVNGEKPAPANTVNGEIPASAKTANKKKKKPKTKKGDPEAKNEHPSAEAELPFASPSANTPGKTDKISPAITPPAGTSKSLSPAKTPPACTSKNSSHPDSPSSAVQAMFDHLEKEINGLKEENKGQNKRILKLERAIAPAKLRTMMDNLPPEQKAKYNAKEFGDLKGMFSRVIHKTLPEKEERIPFPFDISVLSSEKRRIISDLCKSYDVEIV